MLSSLTGLHSIRQEDVICTYEVKILNQNKSTWYRKTASHRYLTFWWVFKPILSCNTLSFSPLSLYLLLLYISIFLTHWSPYTRFLPLTHPFSLLFTLKCTFLIYISFFLFIVNTHPPTPVAVVGGFIAAVVVHAFTEIERGDKREGFFLIATHKSEKGDHW